MNRRFLTALAQVSLISMLAACSPTESRQADTAAESSAAASASTTDATTHASSQGAPVREVCSLLTADEVGKILGSPATATPRPSSSNRSGCDYVTQSFQSLAVEAIWSGAEEEIQSARSAASAAAGAAGGTQDAVVNEVMGVQRVEGLGDEAYFVRRGFSHVRKGDVLLVFHTAGLNEPARENWEALARATLARL